MPQIYTTPQLEAWEVQPNCNVIKRWSVLDQNGDPIDVSTGCNVQCMVTPPNGSLSGNGIVDLDQQGTWTKGDGFIECELNNADVSVIQFEEGTYALYVGETGALSSNRALVAYGSWNRIQVQSDISGGV